MVLRLRRSCGGDGSSEECSPRPVYSRFPDSQQRDHAGGRNDSRAAHRASTRVAVGSRAVRDLRPRERRRPAHQRQGAQHLPHPRPPSQAAQALDGVRQPRPVQVDAGAARARARHPAHRLALPLRVRVGTARAHRATGRASPTRRSAASRSGPTRRAGAPTTSICCAPPTSSTTTRASSDATWARLAARYNKQQMLDILFAVGQYTLVSMVLNSCGVRARSRRRGLPRRRRGRGVLTR